jgi:hypothetical protein
MNEVAVLRRREERWDRIDMGREDDLRLAPTREEVEAFPLNRHPLDGAEPGEVLEQEVADGALVAGDRLDVDESAGQGDEVHGAGE